MRKNTLFTVSLIVLFVIFGTIFATVQQFLRVGANDPQIQLAQDAAAALDIGQSPGDLVGGGVEMDKSLAPFIMVYDKTGKLLSGNGLIGNKLTKVPAGVLTSADGKAYSTVTWQPVKNVRIATAVVSSKKYYVLSGRSLKEVEQREQSAMNIALSGGVLAAAVVFGGMYVELKWERRKGETALAAEHAAPAESTEITSAAAASSANPKKQARRRKS